MTRVKRGVTARKKHKKILKQAKGYYGARSRVFRTAKQAVIKSHQYSYISRKQKKRTFRSVWITIINAAVNKYNLSYKKFINDLNQNNILINRKMFYLLIKKDENTFKTILNNLNK